MQPHGNSEPDSERATSVHRLLQSNQQHPDRAAQGFALQSVLFAVLSFLTQFCPNTLCLLSLLPPLTSAGLLMPATTCKSHRASRNRTQSGTNFPSHYKLLPDNLANVWSLCKANPQLFRAPTRSSHEISRQTYLWSKRDPSLASHFLSSGFQFPGLFHKENG